jgi:hypothetical protein
MDLGHRDAQPVLRPEEVLRPVEVRPVDHNRYEIALQDGKGHRRAITLTVRWVAGSWGVSRIDGWSMAEPALFDTRPMVALAVAMHRAIHYQWPGPVSPSDHSGPPPPYPLDAGDNGER